MEPRSSLNESEKKLKNSISENWPISLILIQSASYFKHSRRVRWTVSSCAAIYDQKWRPVLDLIK